MAPVLQGWNDTYNFMLAIARGLVPGHSWEYKFAAAVGIQISSNVVDIWDGVEDAAADDLYTYSTTADIDSLSSSDNSDTEVIRVFGLDTDWNVVVQDITLIGQTRVPLNTALIRVYRMQNIGTTDIAGRVFCYVNGAITTGVPDVSTTIRAIIKGDNNQTLMSQFPVPLGKTACLWRILPSINKKISAGAKMSIRALEFGQVFRIQDQFSVISQGSSSPERNYEGSKAFPAKTDIVVCGETDTNDTDLEVSYLLVLTDNK